MIKKLCTLLMLTILSAPLLAQTVGSESDGVLFAPKKGQWQVSVLLGGGNNFYNENTSYLLPKNTHTGGEVGLPNGGGANSGDLNRYLNIDGLNNNSLTNITGVEGKYFISDCWDINFQFAMNINLTPRRTMWKETAAYPIWLFLHRNILMRRQRTTGMFQSVPTVISR